MHGELVDAVLGRLGLPARPAADLAGLHALYAAWCERVPFDNVNKRLHLWAVRQGEVAADAPLPGSEPRAFFERWLTHGTGGTCWAGNGALHALLEALGFEVERGLATMLPRPDLPPNHGTVGVLLAGARYLVDASMLTQEPLRLEPDATTRLEHPAWGVRCEPVAGHHVVVWRPLHHPEPFGCRIERFGLSAEEFFERHQATRTWSPFNYSISLRINRGGEVRGLGLGRSGRIDPAGRSHEGELSVAARTALLVELSIDPALAGALPPDEPLPSP